MKVMSNNESELKIDQKHEERFIQSLAIVCRLIYMLTE